MVLQTHVNKDSRTTIPKTVRELLDIIPEKDDVIWMIDKRNPLNGVRMIKFIKTKKEE